MPIVVGATVVGLVGVLTFHTKPAPLTLGSQSGASATQGSTTTPAAASSSSGASSPPKSGSKTSTPTVPATSTPTTIPSATRRATGAAVDYHYGVLSVSITASGNRISKVSIASLNDGGNFRSQSIDQQSIPILEQQALQAQNANIQGVSGASYTSAGFEQSLQSALGKLGLS
ncbi:MAG: FMN-binding protein [Nitrososphaerales archaeon]